MAGPSSLVREQSVARRHRVVAVAIFPRVTQVRDALLFEVVERVEVVVADAQALAAELPESLEDRAREPGRARGLVAVDGRAIVERRVVAILVGLAGLRAHRALEHVVEAQLARVVDALEDGLARSGVANVVIISAGDLGHGLLLAVHTQQVAARERGEGHQLARRRFDGAVVARGPDVTLGACGQQQTSGEEESCGERGGQDARHEHRTVFRRSNRFSSWTPRPWGISEPQPGGAPR